MSLLKCQKIKDLAPSEIKKWFESIDTILVDCDGVIWFEDAAVPDVPEVLNTFKKIGKKVILVTNNGTKTREELWERARKVGYDINVEDILSPTYSIAQFLKSKNIQKKVYIVGSEGISKELDKVDIKHFGVGPDPLNCNITDYIENEVQSIDPKEVAAVIVGYDEHFSYGKMMKAANILGSNPDCYFLTTNVDGVHNFPGFCIPGTGSMLKAIECCTYREAKLMGKPNPMICDDLKKTGVIVPSTTLMVGDCYKIDVLFGKKCGFQTMLVGTGCYTYDDVQKLLQNPEEKSDFIPDMYSESLGDLLPFLHHIYGNKQ